LPVVTIMPILQEMSPSELDQAEEPLNISLVSIEKEGLVRLASSGSITAAKFDPSGRNPLERILGQNWSGMRILIDMKQTTYVDSSAVGWLIATNRACRDAGGKLVIHDLPSNIRQILDLLQVGRVVSIAESAQAARDLILGGDK
jgi:anti-anti-sigma factor